MLRSTRCRQKAASTCRRGKRHSTPRIPARKGSTRGSIHESSKSIVFNSQSGFGGECSRRGASEVDAIRGDLAAHFDAGCQCDPAACICCRSRCVADTRYVGRRRNGGRVSASRSASERDRAKEKCPVDRRLCRRGRRRHVARQQHHRSPATRFRRDHLAFLGRRSLLDRGQWHSGPRHVRCCGSAEWTRDFQCERRQRPVVGRRDP